MVDKPSFNEKSQRQAFAYLGIFFLIVYLFIFYQLEANYFTILQWFLSYIDMNQRWIYMYSPSQSPLPPPSPPNPSGSFQCTRSEHLSHASNLGWWSVSPQIIYMFRWCSLETSHPRLLPQSPKFCSVHLCLFFCFACRVIITIFLNSIYMCQYAILVFIFLAYFTLYDGQPRCPSADEWIRKLWYIYTMEYYSAIKKNSCESVLMRWMKLEPIIKTTVFLKSNSGTQHCLSSIVVQWINLLSGSVFLEKMSSELKQKVICMAESLCCPPETITLSISYTPT